MEQEVLRLPAANRPPVAAAPVLQRETRSSGVHDGVYEDRRPLHPQPHNESVIRAIRADEGRRKREHLARAAQQRRDKRLLFLRYVRQSPDEVLTVDHDDEDQEEEAEAKVGHVSHRNTRSAISDKRGPHVQPLLSRPSIVGDCDDEDMEVDSDSRTEWQERLPKWRSGERGKRE